MNRFFFCLMLIVFFSFSLHAGKNKKNNKQYLKSNIETVVLISDPEEFGFSYFKSWHELNTRKQKTKERENINRLNIALKAKNEQDNNLYEKLIREGAKQNCDNAMLHLGYLEEEKGNFEEAYSWYMISLCTKLLKENKLTTIQIQNNNPYDKLLSIIKCENLPEAYKKFSNKFIPYLHYAKNNNDIITSFIQNFYDLTNYNQRLCTFAFELSKWIDNKVCLCLLGQVFDDNYNLPEIAAHFFRLSKTDVGLSDLYEMISEEKIKTDLNGKTFDSNNKEHVLAEILLKIKKLNCEQLYNVGILIINGTILKLDGKTIPKNKRYEIATTYLRKAQTKEAYNEIGLLILNNKIQHDEDNVQIQENNKFDIAARNFRKSGLPIAMIELARLIYYDYIAQDEKGYNIPKESKYNAIERIVRKYIELPYSKTLLAHLIVQKKTDKDEFDQKFFENQRYEVASRLYLKSPCAISYDMIAYLITCDLIDCKKGLQILGYNQEILLTKTKNEIIAELCRHSKSSWALHFLGTHIYKGLINKDENNNDINENQRIEKSINLLQQSSIPEAIYDLTIIKLQNTPIQSIETIKDALSSLEKAILLDCSKATELYFILSERLEANLQTKELIEIKIEKQEKINNGYQNINIAENSFKNDTEEHFSQQNNLSEENILDLEVRKKLKAIKKLNKRTKKIKKFNKLIDGKLSQDKTNDLFLNIKNPANKNIKLKAKWNKKSLNQANELLSHEKNKVLLLINDIKHGGTMGRPETLKGCDAMSRRITKEHRLVYRLTENNIEILSCKGHYEDMY